MADVYSPSSTTSFAAPSADEQAILTAREAQRRAQIDAARSSVTNTVADSNAALRAAAEQSIRDREAAARAQMADPQAYAAGVIGSTESEFGDVLGALQARNPTAQAPRPFYAPTKQYTNRMGELVPEAEQAFAGQQAAEVGEARASLDVTEQMANRQQEMLVDMRARDFAESQRRSQAAERVNAAQVLATKAADDFAAHADVDPNRGWANKSAGMKFLAVLSAGLVGAVGGDAMRHIEAVISDDIAAQQASIAKRSAVAQQRSSEVQAERSIYGDFIAQLGDERSAALAYENARLQQFQMQMTGQLQAAGIRTLSAQQQSIMNEFQQRIAQNNLELGMRIEANTPTVTVGGGQRYTGDARRLLVDAGKQALDDRGAARTSIVQTAGRRETEAGELEVARAKADEDATAAQRKELRGEGGIYREAQQFAKEFGPQLAVIGQIDTFLEQHSGDNIPGISRMSIGGEYEGQIADVLLGDEAGASAAVHNALGQIREEIGRARSQGAITEDEEARFNAQVMDGLQTGGARRLKQNLTAIRAAMESRVQPGERALSPEGREYILRNNLIPEFSAARGSATYNKPDPALAREDE